MKVAIIAANGKTGSLVLNECLKKGFEVTAFVRRECTVTNPKVNVVVKDIASLSSDDFYKSGQIQAVYDRKKRDGNHPQRFLPGCHGRQGRGT